MAIFNEAYTLFLLEASHGKLKNSFRTVADASNGHMIKIVYDLNSDDVKQIGDHTHQENRNIKKDLDTIKNINKKGSTDFSSTGTIKAIIDMDTGKRLKSVEGVGVIGSAKNSDRFKVPSNYIDNSTSEYSFSNFSKEDREKMASDDINKNIKGVKYTVGEKESSPSYKSTVATKSTTDLYRNQFDFDKKGRGFDKNRYENSKNIFSTINSLEKEYDSIKSDIDKSNDKALLRRANRFEDRLEDLKDFASENKKEKFGQTSGDAKYNRTISLLKDSIAMIKDDLEESK